MPYAFALMPRQYELCRELEHANRFVVIETYRSLGDFEYHLTSPHMQSWRGKAADLIAAPPAITKYHQVM